LNPVEITLYVKQDCHLCEDMLKNLNTFLSEFEQDISASIIIRDIDDRENWYQRYREYVPVLVVNGEEVCHYFFDSEELAEVIERQYQGAG